MGHDICEFTGRRDRKKSAGMQGLQRLPATGDQRDPLLQAAPLPKIVRALSHDIYELKETQHPPRVWRRPPDAGLVKSQAAFSARLIAGLLSC